MRLLLCVAAIISFARCAIEERPEDKNYVDEIVEEQGFDDLTVEEEPMDQEDSPDAMPLLQPSPSFTPTFTTASTSDSQSPLLMSSPDTLPPSLQSTATSTTGRDLSVTISPSMGFMRDHAATNSQLVSPLDSSPQVLIPPPDELPEDVTETPPPTQSTTMMTTTSRSAYTILTVAIVPPIGDMFNVMDTEKERANYTFNGMTTQQPAATTMAPNSFRTTLVDEVVTFMPPSDPPAFATLLQSIPTSTQRPRLIKLNDGEVKHKRRSSGKVKKTNFALKNTIGEFKRKLHVEKVVKRLRSNRKVISRDVGPVGRRVPVPRGWRVTSIRRA